MSQIKSVGIVGLGLIGGSLARDLAARGVRVAALDADVESYRKSDTEGVVSDFFARGTEPIQSDVVVLAVPVMSAADVLESLQPRLHEVRLVTDVGSTKRSIVQFAERLGAGDRFVGSHPLAGSHRSGWDASRTGLFEGARVYLSPTRSTDADALELARELWTMVGAVPEVMDAADHDRRLAWTSHLPQAVSTALARALSEAGIARSDLGSGGRDVTRLAGSSPEMWADILLDNADAILPAMDAVQEELRALRQVIASGDRGQLRQRLARGREWYPEQP